MKTLIDTIPLAANERPPVGLRLAFLVAGAVAVLLAQAPLATLAARVIG